MKLSSGPSGALPRSQAVPGLVPPQPSRSRWACPDHARPCRCGRTVLVTDVVPCPHHPEPACSSCSFQCVSCGQTRCACKKTPCRFCAGAHCPDCLGTCGGCGQAVAGSHLEACPSGCGPRCPACRVPLKHEGGRPGCRSCAVPCARCGAWEPPPRAGRCGFCEDFLCRTCAPRAPRCGSCNHPACQDSHLGTCTGGELACAGCTRTCEICMKPACTHHGRPCLDCARWTCTAHQQPCRWCGAAVCGPCSQGGLCSLCRSLEPLEDPAELKRLLASLQAHGRVVRGFQTVRTARSGLRTLVVFGWRFGGEEFYSLGPEGLALPRSRRALGRFLNSDTEPLP